MKYMLMRNAMKAGFDWYAKYPKKDLEANVAFMPLSAKNSENRARSLATEGLDFPRPGQDCAPGLPRQRSNSRRETL